MYQGNFTWHYSCFKDYCYQEIIYGPLDGATVSPDKPWPYKGRDPSQAFLYEIVANKSCSIDVDKVCNLEKVKQLANPLYPSSLIICFAMEK